MKNWFWTTEQPDAREVGNAAFREKNHQEAVAQYSAGLEQCVGTDQKVQRATLLSNRSAAFASMRRWDEALADADEAVALRPEWAKGWARKGKAHHALRQHAKAAAAYARGCEAALKHADELEQRQTKELEAVKRQAATQAAEYARVLEDNASLRRQLDDYLCMFDKSKRG